MRRILVPLDGTDLAASILPDARRAAGEGGELILIRDAAALPTPYSEAPTMDEQRYLFDAADDYLKETAAALQADGIVALAKTFVLGDAAKAIDEAARVYRADMIACATHGRNPVGRLVRGGVAWRALAHSPVPVLLRHPYTNHGEYVQPPQRHILVPLDGSSLAEQALSLATKLAAEWQASLWLVHVVPGMLASPFHPGPIPDYDDEYVRDARLYLHRLAEGLTGDVHTGVFAGPVVDTLTGVVEEWAITDIVMASHGRTGLSRVFLGSVADELIHRLHLPVVVIPSRALAREEKPAESLVGAHV